MFTYLKLTEPLVFTISEDQRSCHSKHQCRYGNSKQHRTSFYYQKLLIWLEKSSCSLALTEADANILLWLKSFRLLLISCISVKVA